MSQRFDYVKYDEAHGTQAEFAKMLVQAAIGSCRRRVSSLALTKLEEVYGSARRSAMLPQRWRCVRQPHRTKQRRAASSRRPPTVPDGRGRLRG
jgi:hypothetical protein